MKSIASRHKLAIGALLSVAMAVRAETWYLTSTRTDNDAWTGDDAGQYWANSERNPGSGALDSKGTYYVKNGLTLGASGGFGGGDLWIGDPGDSSYSANQLRINAHVSNPNGFIKLWAGYVRKVGNSAALNLGNPIIMSPKDRPFGFVSARHDHTLRLTTAITGEKGVGLVMGGYYDGTTIQYMTTTNVTFAVNHNIPNGLAGYHGDIRIVSNKPLTTPTKGNVTFNLQPTASDATLEIEGGAEFKVSSAGEIKLSGLTLHSESLITIPYDSAAHTTGVIRVADTFSIPENEGKVRIWFKTQPVAKNHNPCEFPLLVVPNTQTLDVNRFVLSNKDSLRAHEIPLFSVKEDEENRSRALVATFPGQGKLENEDSNVYTKKTAAEYARLTSAFSDGQDVQWSDDSMPHEFAIYEFGQKLGYGHSIRTPYLRETDYVFPGLVLRTVGNSANFTLADNTKTTINLEVKTDMSLRVVSSLKPTLAGIIYMDCDVKSRAYNGSELTIASVLVGNGNWIVESAPASPVHSTITFTADNSQWKGCLSLMQKNDDTSLDDDSHLKIVVANPAGLGGALDEFNYKAFHLADFSEVIVANSVELSKDLNRGIYVTNTATVNVDADCDFVCNWPITFDGPLRKVGGGTLCLGGDAKFLDSAGELAGVPRSDVDCRLSVTNGAVKALRHDCLNGVTVELLENGCLALDSNPDDAQVRRYGFYNVNTDTPFPADGEINVRIDNPDYAALAAAKEDYKLGLLTVKTSAADALNLDSRVKFNKSCAIDGLLERVIREDDAETGLTTYSVSYDFCGFQVIVK